MVPAPGGAGGTRGAGRAESCDHEVAVAHNRLGPDDDWTVPHVGLVPPGVRPPYSRARGTTTQKGEEEDGWGALGVWKLSLSHTAGGLGVRGLRSAAVGGPGGLGCALPQVTGLGAGVPGMQGA